MDARSDFLILYFGGPPCVMNLLSILACSFHINGVVNKYLSMIYPALIDVKHFEIRQNDMRCEE